MENISKNIDQTKIMKERNHSIDLLRIIAMLMIVIWHCGNHGMLEYRSESLDAFNIWIHFIQALCSVAVDVYVLISGYFLCTQKFRISRLVKLVIQTVFYSWCILILCKLILKIDIPIFEQFTSLLPISYQHYWFVSVYMGLCLLSPILNKLIHSLSKQQHLASIVLLLLTCSLWRDLLPCSFALNTEDGKRLIWFITVYIVSSYFRLHIDKERINTKKCFTAYLLISLLLLLVWIIIYYMGSYIGIDTSIRDFGCRYYYRYCSLLVFIPAVCLFATFLNITINNNYIKRGISIIAPLTFGVYLIHDNKLLYDFIWGQVIHCELFGVKLAFYGLLYSFSLFIVCVGIDYVRNFLFSFFYRSKIWLKFVNYTDKLYASIYTIFLKATK